MINRYFKKGLVLGIIFLFLCAIVLPIVNSYPIKQKALTGITITNSKVCSSLDTLQFRLIDLWLSINATGKTSTNLSEFKDEWRTLLIFNFTNPDAEVKIGWLGLPLWKWFPRIYDLIGPHIYIAIMFFGSIEKIDDVYYIQGHAFRAGMKL